MQDSHPPHSIEEIRLLMARYLEQDLSPDEVSVLLSLLESFPEYQTEWRKMQATRSYLQELPDRKATFTEESADFPASVFWQRIASRLESDAEVDVLAVDPVFISAYYDGEIEPDDPLKESFEAQLYRNDGANRVLADMAQMSDAVRQFAYRQESACELDLTSQVMEVFRREAALQGASDSANPVDDPQEESVRAAAPSPLTDSQVEMLSAHVDAALSPRDTMQLNRLIEQEPSAKVLLSRFVRLSDCIRMALPAWQANAPDCLTRIRSQLPIILEENVKSTVTPLLRRPSVRRAVRLAGPVAAVGLLLLLSVPMLRLDVGLSPSGGRLLSSRTEIASLPPQTERLVSHQRHLKMMMPEWPAPTTSSLNIPSKPILEPLSRAASSAIITDTPPRKALLKSPTSEEYLFKALSERNGRGDASAIWDD